MSEQDEFRIQAFMALMSSLGVRYEDNGQAAMSGLQLIVVVARLTCNPMA